MRNSSVVVVIVAWLCACAVTAHPVTPARIGVPQSGADLEAVVDQPGPIRVETVVAARWEVALEGLLNLDHPTARAAQLSDRPEPIMLFVHVLHHPQRGTFFVDTGVERAFVADPANALLNGILGSLAQVERMQPMVDTATLVRLSRAPIAGVFLTHLHPDHVLGLRDLPERTPIYVGAGDAQSRSFMNLFTRGLFGAALANKPALREIAFQPDTSGMFAGVLDVFGDASLWALWVPGHTPGTIAYLARTPQGPVLLTGDACHTAWGWLHQVEPGTFSEDQAESAISLGRLARFARRHPSLDVRLGHQSLPR